MDKYIKKETAIKSLLNDCLGQVSYSREDAADCIFWLDTADVAPVRHGRWILGTGENALQKGYRMCSQCGEIVKYAYTLYGEHNFCNYCGAKMDDE